MRLAMIRRNASPACRLLGAGVRPRCSFAGKLIERAPGRVVAAAFCQTVGHRPEDPTVMYRHSSENWVPDFRKRRPDVPADAIEKYLHELYAAQPDFLHSVPRDVMRNCQTPIMVLPDDVPSHPLQTSIDVASLAAGE